MPIPPRFSGFAFPQGLMVLDGRTGEVVLVPVEGERRTLREAQASADARDESDARDGSDGSESDEDERDRIHASRAALSTLVDAEGNGASAGGDGRVNPGEKSGVDEPNASTRTATTGRVTAKKGDGRALDHEVITTFPYPVASVYARFFDERDPRQRCRLLVDTFTLVLKSWALQLALEYLRAGEARDPHLNQLLARDFQRPLLSVWNLFIARALPVLRESGTSLFSPELEVAYDRLEGHCRDPFLARTRYEDSEGKERFRESRLGKIQALIRYRNSLAHGYNAPKGKATHELGIYLPMLRDILAEARFMARYPLVFVERKRSSERSSPPSPLSLTREGEQKAQAQRQGLSASSLLALQGEGGRGGEDSPRLFRLMGATVPLHTEVVPAGLEGVSGLALMSPDGGVLPLSVLFDLDEAQGFEAGEKSAGKETFLFEGNTRSTIIYTSPSGAYIEKASRMDAWRSMLAAKDVDGVGARPTELSLDGLRASAQRVRESHLSGLISAGKYLREVSISHPVFAERLAQFELGDYRGMVVVGESGSGKSTTLALHAEESATAGDVVLFYRGSALLDVDLQSRIVRDLGAKDMYLEDLLAAMGEACFEGTSARLRIIVDGVNEHPTDVEGMARSIDALVRQAESFPWCRVVAGMRTASFERLSPEARFGHVSGARYLRTDERRGARVISTPVVPLPPLDLATVGTLYERYRAFRQRGVDELEGSVNPEEDGVYAFRPTTSFNELQQSGEGTTIALMRTPLMMRLLLAAFNRRALPLEISFDEAMRLYFDHVIVGRGDGAGDAAGERPERGAFLLTLVRALDAASTDAIARDVLYEIPALKAALQNPQKDSPYVQLLELGVLVETWDRDTCLVRFSFDKLHEFLLAEIHATSFLSASGALELAARAVRSAGLRGALAVGWIRSCRDGHGSVMCDALDRCGDLPADTRVVVEQVARSVLEHLARARDPSFASMLDEMAIEPSESDVRALLDVFDRLFATGEVVGAASVADAALGEAEKLDSMPLIAGSLFRRGVIQQQRGDLSAALASHDRARALALATSTEAGAVLAHRIDVVRSEIVRLRGDTDEALTLLAACGDALRSEGAWADAAEARRQQAILVLARGRRDEGQALLDEALSLARESGDAQAETGCLISWGVASWKDGDLPAAERWFEQARAIADTTGHVRSMSHIAGNLGLLCRERGALREAIVHMERQLALANRIGHRHSAGIALLNLGVLLSEVGESDASVTHFLAARDTFEHVGDRAALAMTLNNLAALRMYRGELDLARNTCQQALDVATSLPDADTIADARWLLATMAFDADDLSEAQVQAAAFVPAVPETDDPRRRAQLAALQLRSALREKLDVLDAASSLLAAVRLLKTRVDVHELPIAAFVEHLEALAQRRAPGVAELAIEALAWIDGRPSTHEPRLRALGRCGTERAPWLTPLASPSPS